MTDPATMDDLTMAIEALQKALDGLKAGDQDGRDHFAWGLGFALGRLSRARERFYRRPDTVSDWKEAKG